MMRVLWILGVLLLGVVGEVQAATYLNCGTSEPAINAASTTLWCDDFEDGSFIETVDDPGNPNNDGWNGSPFNDPPDMPAGTYPDPHTGSMYGRCQTAAGPAFVTGLANTGVAGTNCAGTSGLMADGGSSGPAYQCCQMATMAGHNIPININLTNRDLYVRYYRKCISTNPICGATGSNTKVGFTFNLFNGLGGIHYAATGAFPDGRSGKGVGNMGAGTNDSHGCTGAVLCQTMNVINNKIDGDQYLPQNLIGVGPNDTGDCGISPLQSCYEFGNNTHHWYYIEHHIRVESCSSCTDGWYELWLDDCGVTGLTGGCATGGTMRTRYTDTQWDDGQAGIGFIWLENHAGIGPSALRGEWYYDQFVASTVRVGPLASGADITPPAAPTNLHFTNYVP